MAAERERLEQRVEESRHAGMVAADGRIWSDDTVSEQRRAAGQCLMCRALLTRSSTWRQALAFSQFAPFLRRVLVNGAMGIIAAPEGKIFSLTGFTVSGGKIVAMDILADPECLRRIDLAGLGE